MALEIASAGAKIQWAVETTAGTRPTTGYTAIQNVKTIGALDSEPSTYDVTDLSDMEFKRYIPGLKDIGGDVPLTFNLTQALITAWAALVTAADTAAAAGKSTWFEVVIPKLNESFYFRGVPSPLGLSEVATDTALEMTAHVTPNEIVGWATKSTQ
jgi:hypothetical protein